MNPETKLTDEQIQRDVVAALKRRLGDDAVEVDVRVKNGTVKLTGAVEERPAAEQLEEIVRSCSGVMNVETYVTVGPNQIDKKQVAINLHRN